MNPDNSMQQGVPNQIPNPAANTIPQPPPAQQQPTADNKKEQEKVNQNSTQNTLQIAEIRDGIVITTDGSFRSIVMTKSINFDLMNNQEREATEFGYQAFLNSLDFPIQISIKSTRIDLRPYLERMEKIRSEHDNMLLSMLMGEYIAFLNDISEQTNIMNKEFYIVIPYSSWEKDPKKIVDSSKGFASNFLGAFRPEKPTKVTIDEPKLEEAKIELRNRVQAVLGGLMQVGVQGIPLSTQELIELYYNSYNPDTATRQQLLPMEQLTTPYVTKGVGNAYQPNLGIGQQ